MFHVMMACPKVITPRMIVKNSTSVIAVSTRACPPRLPGGRLLFGCITCFEMGRRVTLDRSRFSPQAHRGRRVTSTNPFVAEPHGAREAERVGTKNTEETG